ncbi:hypothetical protein C8R43DRAFT_1021656 [Mycena crocata]|nr:hypothetical protein C8R43DRAFT_1021656 [Mycena crocata]
MSRFLSLFEGKESKKARVEAEIVERGEKFRASPTVKIGSVTVINPTYEGPNPFQVPELLDPENEGVLITPVEAETEPEPDAATVARHSKKRRDRSKREAYTKTPWLSVDESGRGGHSIDVARSPRFSAPPLTTVPSFVSDADPFRKDPLSHPTTRTNSFFMGEEKRKVDSTQRVWGTLADILQGSAMHRGGICRLRSPISVFCKRLYCAGERWSKHIPCIT